MNQILKHTLAACALVLMAASCQKYNPFDSYYHGGIDRPETGGIPGKNGLFADGFGTEDSPYGLSTPQHLKNMSRALIGGEMIYFILKNDIDMSGETWTALNPVTPYNKFIDFNGNGHVIYNLYCGQQEYGSFFGVLCGNCYDVGFINAYAESSNGGGVIGGYVGLANPEDSDFTGHVDRVFVTGTVRAGGSGGGICGTLGKTADMVKCSITDCYSLVEVNGGDAGGLVGDMRDGEIIRSYATGIVNGSSTDGKFAGGLVGIMKGGQINNSIAWNKGIGSGATRGNVYGSKTDGTLSDVYYLGTMSGVIVNNENVTKKTAAELQAIAATWTENWHSNGAVSNGYPIMKWLYERGDYGDISGHGGGGASDKYKPSFNGGTGTESDPYLIASLTHLRSMHDTLKAGTAVYFKLEKDIDAAALSHWAPLNIEDPFDKIVHLDGNNKTISNLKSSNETYPSFFGVLNGSVKNLTFKNCQITQIDNSPCGILGGFGGSQGGATAYVENVKLDGGSVTSSGKASCGGMFGSSANATIKNCTNSVTVKSTNPSTTTSEQGCGGFVGKIVRNTSIDNCQFTGKVDGVRLVGGIAGWAVEADNSITNSFNTAAITATKTGDAKGERTGGIIGHLGAGSFISKCYNSGSISGAGMQGGIAGYLEGNKSDSDKGYIEKCYSTGNITCKGGNFAGGICAYMQSGEISNCYTKNGSTSVSGQSTGGIVGEVKTNAIIKNCWSSMVLSGYRVLGGIAGRCAMDNWNATATDAAKQAKITISDCIAWNPSITASEKGTPQDKGSSGGVIAYTYIKNTLSNCIRRSDMNFTGSFDGYGLVDQENVSPTAPLTVGVEAKYCYPYHGKKTTATSIKAVATSLGWDANIWDLSKDEPTLK